MEDNGRGCLVGDPSALGCVLLTLIQALLLFFNNAHIHVSGGKARPEDELMRLAIVGYLVALPCVVLAFRGARPVPMLPSGLALVLATVEVSQAGNMISTIFGGGLAVFTLLLALAWGIDWWRVRYARLANRPELSRRKAGREPWIVWELSA